jgi:hypothetical protein
MNRKSILTLVLIAMLQSTYVALGQLVLTGTNYFQDFNTISNGLPVGWTVRTNATSTSLGTNATFWMLGKTWGESTGEFGNCASTLSNAGTNFIGAEIPSVQHACTNRALAIRQTASFGDPGAAFVLEISNTVGMRDFSFSVDLEMLKINPLSTTWSIEYAVGNSPAAFTTLGTYADPGAFGAINRTFSLGADADNQSSKVWIRIVALTAATGTTGTRDTFGIDNFSLSWSAMSVNAPVIVSMTTSNGNARLNFSGDINDTPDAFLLQSTSDLSVGFTNVNATITQSAPGSFQAVCDCGGEQQFYRIKRR